MRQLLTDRIATTDDGTLPLPALPGEGDGYTSVLLTLEPGEFVLDRRPDGRVDLVEIRTMLRRAGDPSPIWQMATAVPTGDRQPKGPPTPDEMNKANRKYWEGAR